MTVTRRSGNRDRSAAQAVWSSLGVNGEDAIVVLEHPGHPGLRFGVVFDRDGRPVSWTVAARHLLPQLIDPAPTPADDSITLVQDPELEGPILPVSATVLRDAPYGELERAARARIEEDATDIASGLGNLSVATRRNLDRMRRRVATARRPGPKSGDVVLDDLHFAKVARDYVAALQGPEPIKTVAGLWGYSRGTVQNWLTEARSRELLTKPRPGRAEGALTSKAKKILRDSERKGR